MEHRGATVIAAGTLVLVAGALGYALRGDPPPRAPLHRPTAAADPRIDRLADRLDRIDARLEEMATSLRAPGSGEARAVPAVAPAGEAGAEYDPRTLSDAELQLRARAVGRNPRDAAEALRLWNAILERVVTAEDRGEALMEKGQICRALQQRDIEEDCFRKAVEALGADCEKGQHATFQLGWTATYRQDLREALEIFDGVGRHPASGLGVRISARVQVATLAEQLGDRDRARRELEALKADYASQAGPYFDGLRTSIETRLARLQ